MDRWKEIASRLRLAKHIALFLDFDGTLVRFRRRPEQVWLGAPMRRVLGRLVDHPRVTVWVMSGRRLRDLRKRVKVRRVRCVGLHGWERGDKVSYAGETRVLLQRAKRLLAKRLVNLVGIWIEDKRLSLVVHYRGAPGSAVRWARAVVSQTLASFEPKLRMLRGQKIWEILPQEVKGKGTAVRMLLAELPEPALPIYVGDDVTDESAFASLPRGVTVRVGSPRPTKARFRLRNPEQVRNFLEKLEAEIS